MASVLKVRELRKFYPKVKAVDGVSFEVEEGQCLGLLGPNGAGKSTTIEMLEGLVKPTSGEILYRGHALAWPFQESTLSTELPKLIVEQVTEKAISCPARKYSMTNAGAVISSADESHWTLNAQGNPAIGPLVAGAELDALVGKDLKIDITRCCDQTPDPSGSCKSEYIQSIEFQLQK